MTDNIHLNIAQDKGLIAEDDWEGWRLTKKGERMLSALMSRENGTPGIAENGDFPDSELLEAEPEVFRWEYAVRYWGFYDRKKERLEEWLNIQCKEEWELVQVIVDCGLDYQVIFKRRRIE